MAFSKLTSVARPWRAATFDRQGAVAVEAAFALLFLIVALAGVFDFGGYIRAKADLEQALRAGAQHALDLGTLGLEDYNTVSTLESSIRPVVAGAAKLVTIAQADVSVATECICPEDGLPKGCPGTDSYEQCTDSNRPGTRYLELTATTTYNPAFTFLPFFSTGMTVGERLSMAVQ